MKKTSLILALDQGTTSSRAILFDRELKIVATAQQEFGQFYPQPGWVEHDPEEIWRSQRKVMADVVKQTPDGPAAVAAIGVTNQRETVVVWNRRTGEPIYPAIVWQCRRTADFCSELKRRDYGPRIRDKTGLVIDAYFSASKLRWILAHVDGAREAAQRGELLCGTIDSWLLWKLSNGTAHVTDYTNASRTMLFNIRTLQWDAELLDLFDIPSSMLPTPVPSSGEAARCVLPEFEGREVPVLGVSGDQQAALFGQGCFAPGQIKNTYGTGCFLLMHTGGEAVSSANGLVTTLTAQTLAGAPSYALEGSVFVGGAVVQWLRDELCILTQASDVGPIAASIPDTGGVFLVPAFAGLGAPHWDMYARGALVGMTCGTGRAQIIRAAVESIAYQCRDVVDAMRLESGQPIASLRADGGASACDFLMQFQADLLECRVERPTCIETTALGAASLAALALGWQTPETLAGRTAASVFTPSMPETQRNALLAGWRKAVSRAARWETES
ncbi:MAG TPA: glycerol kinase GlpK [Kiritimatiellia bacterium]|jgi:glycerol kinase|nr:glycerol kinase GlpK [Kiritimatiellia bacterium]HPW75628.1 glycerol kinase GlpK [Kiritimatiellia bacterium]